MNLIYILIDTMVSAYPQCLHVIPDVSALLTRPVQGRLLNYSADKALKFGMCRPSQHASGIVRILLPKCFWMFG